jgi:16S rRNA U516 pseudouridylate synthase RsuA-like enzyme
MDEERFNMALRKFLKEVGVTSQREIEKAVRDGKARGGVLKVKMSLISEDGSLDHVVEGEIPIG